MRTDTARIGAKIRAYREKKKVTLVELSKLTGIAASNLSSIELDKTSPTLSTLMKIASVFGVKVGAFLDEALYRKAVMCPADAIAQESETHAQVLTTRLTAGVAMNRMDGRVITLSSGHDAVALEGRGTDRLVYCLEGAATLQVDEEEFFLNRGDALYLLPEASAWVTSFGSVACSLLVVSTPAARELP